MSNKLDAVVNVNISIASPTDISENLDSILILGLPPATEPPDPLPDVGVYTDLAGVIKAGYKADGLDADPVGIAARIAFAQNPKPDRIFIAALKETASLVLESPIDALNRAMETPGWYVICPAGIEDMSYWQIAEWTEEQEKMFAYTFLSTTDLLSDIYYRSQSWCGLEYEEQNPGDVPESNSYLHVAVAAALMAYQPGRASWAFKELKQIQPSKFSAETIKNMQEAHNNFYMHFGGKDVTMNAQVRAGEWIDIIHGRDWIQNDMQLRIFNLLRKTDKLPYNNNGIALIEAQMIATLKEAQTRNIVAADVFDDDDEVIPGFTTSVPNALNISDVQKASRVLTDCKFSARLAGAIHAAEIKGGLTY